MSGVVEAKTDMAAEVPAVNPVDNGTVKSEDTVMKNGEEASSDTIMQNADSTASVKVEETPKAASPQIKKTTRQHNEEKPSSNRVYDASTQPASTDPSAIRAQVEFYFSDSNLVSDRHLKNLIEGEKNVPVKVSHIHSFSRMKRFQPYPAVVAALKDSSVFKVDGPEGEETIQRVYPFSEEKNLKDHERMVRSVYVKGFGDEEPTSQFDIEAFFSNLGLTTKQVRLRRTNQYLFKGSVFVEFEDVETAEKFLNLDPKPKYKGSLHLLIKPRQVYEEEKKNEIEQGKKNPMESKYNKGRGGFRGDKDDWKNRRDHDRKNGFRGGRGGGARGGRGNNRGRGPNGRDKRDSNGDKNGDEPKAEAKDPSADNANKETKAGDVKQEAEAPSSGNANQETKAGDVKQETEVEPSNKRAREEDNTSEAPAAKKEKLEEKTAAE